MQLHVSRDWLEWLVALFTIIGVALAIVQSFRSLRLQKATVQATRRAERHFTSGQLISVVPTLQNQLRTLVGAVERTDPAEIDKALGDWSSSANEFLGMLGDRDDIDAEVLRSLRILVGAISNTQQAHGSGRGLKTQMKELNTAAYDAFARLSQLAGKLKNAVPEEGHDD